MLIIRGVNVFPSQIEALLLDQAGLAPHYLLEVRRERHLDELTVKVEARPEAASLEARTSAAALLQHALRSHLGLTIKVEVLEPGAIERSAGKAKRIVDLRAKD
jgi:phenylacetate-CoA ligase